jgi:8-oxo-dGTP pyrophosphatase MutT (NUDIX family)
MAAVKALVERDGKFLALKTRLDEDNHIWTLPGGRVEYGENPLEALHREVEEETSLDIEVNDCVGMYHFFIGPNNNGDQVVLTVFTAENENGVVNISDNPADEDIEGYQWVRPENFLEKTENDSLRRLIRETYNLEQLSL